MKRLPSLDILRGFALCGILFANAPAILRLSPVRADGTVDPVVRWLEFAVYNRFFPMFSLLFGVSFALMWQSARGRTGSPRVVMLRRILAIGLLGAVHQLLQPGEALLPYAIVALVLLLPATFLPTRWTVPVTAGAGAVVTVVAAVAAPGLFEVPGLFLLGFAAGMAGLPARLAESGHRVLPVALLVLGLAAVPALLLQSAHPEFGAIPGLILAAAYGCAVLLLLDHRAASPVAAILSALGRTALTNYLAATVFVVAARAFAPRLGLDPTAPRAWSRMLVLCVAILAVQAFATTWWLRRFRQGPVEYLVRRASWAGATPAREADLVQGRSGPALGTGRSQGDGLSREDRLSRGTTLSQGTALSQGDGL
ncbi:DUF418 domain-containing protein, partial [Nocardia sp. NPDC004722]